MAGNSNSVPTLPLSFCFGSGLRAVDQSLALWSIIMHDIYQMWYLADQDLLSSYHVLRDTGQGLNRVQKCPSIGRAMSNVISRAQGRIGGGWVGSSVVHLGDHNGKP